MNRPRTISVHVGDVDVPVDEIEEQLGHTASLEVVQDVFDRVGPERDRRTDWTKCAEEPWRSLATAMGAR